LHAIEFGDISEQLFSVGIRNEVRLIPRLKTKIKNRILKIVDKYNSFN